MAVESVLKLPKPRFKGKITLEEAFRLRRTTRSLSEKEISKHDISQVLWALQGVTHVEKPNKMEKILHRAAPSAGKTYPLEVYVASSKGFYRYEAERHALSLIKQDDIRSDLSEAALTPLNKEAIRGAPLTIILAVDNEKALKATPLMESAVRFAHLEAGHATQNLLLQAVSLGLGVCTVTSFTIAKVYDALKIPLNHRSIYLLPIGYPKTTN